MSIEELYYEMKSLTENSEKFFMNVSEYRGKRVAMFDYGLAIPMNFSSKAALETRGSVFEIDENNNYVRVLCRPFEKFFNLHEYDYDGTEGLLETTNSLYGINIASSEDVRNLDVAYAMNKEDGSIISAFDFDGELDCKSNGSLTSEYKEEGLKLIRNDERLYDKTDTLTSQGYTVCFEFLSDNPAYQIVLSHDTSRMVVTAVRHNETGEYYTYDQLVEHFGEDRVAPKITEWDWNDRHTHTDIEGYVVVMECGLRVKLKTDWYVEKHSYWDFMKAPRRLWECFIKGETDDAYQVIKRSEPLRQHFNNLLAKSDELYTDIVQEGTQFYNENSHLDNRYFFTTLKSHQFKYLPSRSFASTWFSYGHEKALEELKRVLLVRKTISDLGIVNW